MANYPQWGHTFVATATGPVCITSADAAVIGVLFQGSGTGSIQFWAGVTATGAGAQLSHSVRAFITAAAATANTALYIPFPAYAENGLTINVGASSDPKLTLFWLPV